VKTRILSAKGAKCKSLGQRPRQESKTIVKALKARNRNQVSETALIERRKHHFALSALGDLYFARDLGRWPRLLHSAPLALNASEFSHRLYRSRFFPMKII
jgi:hypothetical protein